jgi:HEAT repeat protein
MPRFSQTCFAGSLGRGLLLVLAASAVGCDLGISPAGNKAARQTAAAAADRSDPEAHLRAEKLHASARRGSLALEEVIAALDDPSPLVRRAGLEILASQGPKAAPAVPALLRLLEHEGDRQAAVKTLSSLGPEVLVQAYRDRAAGQPQVRTGILEALGRLGPSASTAVPLLLEALGDADAGVRCTASIALGWTGVRSQEVLQALQERLQDADSQVRFHAAEALARLDSSGAPMVEVLVEHLGKADADRRLAAVAALARLGSAARASTGSLRQLLSRDPDWRVRAAAAKALGRIEGPGAVPDLIEALADDEQEVRNAAAEALGDIGPAAREALPKLRQCLQPLNGRESAYQAIRKIEAGTPDDQRNSTEQSSRPLLDP